MSKFSSETDRHCRFLFFLLVVGAGMLWLPPLTSSLWLDEAYLVHWLTSDGFFKGAEFAYKYSGVGFVYLAVLWVVQQLLGTAEWMLRLPSVVATLLSVLMLMRLGTVLCDRETGIIAAVVFATRGVVAFAAADARPYALAVLTVITAFYFLVKWGRTRRWGFGVGYAFFSVLSVYLHSLFGAMFAVHALYLWMARRGDLRLGPRDLVAVGGVMGLLLLPLLPQVLSLGGRAAALNWAGAPATNDLAAVCAPPLLVFALGLGFFGALPLGAQLRMNQGRGLERIVLVLVAWTVLPPLVLFAMAVISPAAAFLPRYAMQAVPGLSLLVACGIKLVEPPKARRAVVLVIVALSMPNPFAMKHAGEDWRLAASHVREHLAVRRMPVLARTGAVEERRVDWIADPARRHALLAPLAYYGLGEDAILLPSDVDRPDEVDYMERVVLKEITGADCFLLMSRPFLNYGSVPSWLRGRLGPLGFTDREIAPKAGIQVLLFERSPGTCRVDGDA